MPIQCNCFPLSIEQEKELILIAEKIPVNKRCNHCGGSGAALGKESVIVHNGCEHCLGTGERIKTPDVFNVPDGYLDAYSEEEVLLRKKYKFRNYEQVITPEHSARLAEIANKIDPKDQCYFCLGSGALFNDEITYNGCEYCSGTGLKSKYYWLENYD